MARADGAACPRPTLRPKPARQGVGRRAWLVTSTRPSPSTLTVGPQRRARLPRTVPFRRAAAAWRLGRQRRARLPRTVPFRRAAAAWTAWGEPTLPTLVRPATGEASAPTPGRARRWVCRLPGSAYG